MNVGVVLCSAICCIFNDGLAFAGELMQVLVASLIFVLIHSIIVILF